MSDLRKIVIDGNEIEVDPAMTLIQACEQAGIEIPRFCYHERLSIAGNCRNVPCRGRGRPAETRRLLRDAGARPAPRPRGPAAGGQDELSHGQESPRGGDGVFLPESTTRSTVRSAIRAANATCRTRRWPMAWTSRATGNPNAPWRSLDLGPLVETHMTRCISCTRCVRFITEVAGMPELGQTGRGEDAEITSYLGQTLDSEMHGQYRRSLPRGGADEQALRLHRAAVELTKTETIDVMDALGSNIRVDTKGREVMRILPRNNDGVNEEWLAEPVALRLGRAAPPAARQALHPRKRQAQASASWGEGLKGHGHRHQGREEACRARGRSCPDGSRLRAQTADRGAGPDRSSAAPMARSCPRGQPVGLCGHGGDRGYHDAKAIMLIGANPCAEAPGSERAHPQGVAEGRKRRRDRTACRPDL